jgi:hypothetical protein
MTKNDVISSGKKGPKEVHYFLEDDIIARADMKKLKEKVLIQVLAELKKEIEGH